MARKTYRLLIAASIGLILLSIGCSPGERMDEAGKVDEFIQKVFPVGSSASVGLEELLSIFSGQNRTPLNDFFVAHYVLILPHDEAGIVEPSSPHAKEILLLPVNLKEGALLPAVRRDLKIIKYNSSQLSFPSVVSAKVANPPPETPAPR